jgi:carboxymethylenebutenolidase
MYGGVARMNADMNIVSMEVNNDSINGYLSHPESGSGPAVLVIQEWWGVVPHIRSVVDRLAQAGFVALAVDHYRGIETTEPDEAQKLMMGLKVAAAGAEIAAGAEFLLARNDVSSSKVGTVGFCMGGGLSLLAPTVSEAVTAAVAFYPAMPWPDYHPDWNKFAGKKVMIHKAESDEAHAGPRIAEYQRAIESDGGEVIIFDYPNSDHAFFNDDRPEVFNSEYSLLAWQRSIEFLNSQLR